MSSFLEHLSVPNGQRRNYLLTNNRTTIGRASDTDIQLYSRFTSRHHATIELDGNFALLFDHSQNGTFINNILVPKTGQLLKNNDRICFGLSIIDKGAAPENYEQFRFNLVESQPITATIEISDDEETQFCESPRTASETSEPERPTSVTVDDTTPTQNDDHLIVESSDEESL